MVLNIALESRVSIPCEKTGLLVSCGEKVKSNPAKL